MARCEATMRFHRHDSGDIVCTPCKAAMLENVDVALSAYAGHAVDEDMFCRRNQFEALGPRPWAGEDEGYRYIQCDRCLGQWGPDA